MRSAFSKVLLLVATFVWMGFAVNRPSVPGTITATFDPGRNSITVNGSYTAAADSLHVVLLSDLSASIGYAYEIGKHQGSDGPVINYATKTFPITVDLGSQVRERYFAAVAASSLNEKKERIFSGWKLYTDTNGVPVSISTSRNTLGENLFYRARRINMHNSSEVVLDLTFSLPVDSASKYKLEIWRNSRALNLPDLDSITNSKVNIKEAIDNVTLIGGNTLVLKRTSDNFNLYNVYTIFTDYNSSTDSLSALLVEQKTSAIYDTTSKRIPVFSDSSHQNIISTIYDLLRDTSTSNPIYPGTLGAINASDTTKAKLLITAMVDLSLAHNSPQPEPSEAAQGIFTNYIQFMDNVVRNWGTIKTGSIGLQRLKKIHEMVLGKNKGVIVDSVYVRNNGTLSDYGVPEQKRKNYAFYEGYTRLYYECELPVYGASEHSGLGILFKVSNNVKLFEANNKDSVNMFTHTLINSGARRIIIPADDTSKINRFNENGLWVKGIFTGNNKEQTYSTGMYAIRLPLQYSMGNSIPIDTAFSLVSEVQLKDEIAGSLISGFGKNLFKIYSLLNINGIEKKLEDRNTTATIPNEKKFVMIDSAYYGDLNITAEFKAQGTDEQINRLEITPIDRYSAELETEGAGSSVLETRMIRTLPGGTTLNTVVIDRNISTGELFLAAGQSYVFDTVVGYSYELPLILPANLGNFWGVDLDEFVIEITSGIRLFVRDNMSGTKTQILPDVTGKYGTVNSTKIKLPRVKYISDILDKGSSFIIAEAGGENHLTITVNNKSVVEATKAENIIVNAVWKKVVAEPVSNRSAGDLTLTSPPVENPSGLGAKNAGVYRIAVKGADPDFSGEKITWKSNFGSLLVVEQDHGKEGKFKIKDKKTNVDHVLKAELSGSTDPYPEFQIQSLYEKKINITFYIGYDDLGNKLVTDSDIEDMLNEINKIYQQVEMVFARKEIDPLKMTGIDDSLKIIRFSNIIDTAGYYKLVDLDSDTKGVEVYIIKDQYGEAVGRNCARGLAVSAYSGLVKRSTMMIARVIAHEIGHTAGLSDIYDRIVVAGVTFQVPDNTVPSNVLMPGDCNTGTSFYNVTDPLYKYSQILRRLLMYGYESIEEDAGDVYVEKYDIPQNSIYGVGKGTGGVYISKQVDVGLKNMWVNRNGNNIFRDPMHE